MYGRLWSPGVPQGDHSKVPAVYLFSGIVDAWEAALWPMRCGALVSNISYFTVELSSRAGS